MATSNKLPKMAVGQRYGRLTVVALHGLTPNQTTIWKFECDCGREHITTANNVRRGDTKSCGCWKVEFGAIRGTRNKTHGMKKTREYNSWRSMTHRCLNENYHRFKDYGGRGISICDRWMKFENFLSDMGARPEGKTLDRINNNEGYQPSNCKWSSSKEQANNRRTPTRTSS